MYGFGQSSPLQRLKSAAKALSKKKIWKFDDAECMDLVSHHRYSD
jgi:hypothetical protein